MIRHKVFAALRRFCPAKLEGRDKGMLFLMLSLYERGAVSFEAVVICTVAQMGSFGPVVALSSLSNNLNQTLASGERVLSILEETPMVEEVPGDVMTEKDRVETFRGASASHVTFSYEDEVILKDYSIRLEPGKVIGIHGASGSGKSTFLKLLMRFWDVTRGEIDVDGREIKGIPTAGLRDMESYVTQETHLFHDSIANNIAIAKPGASRKEIIEAAEKASIHNFIQRPCRMVMIQRSTNWEIPCQAEKSRGSALPGLFSMMRPSCSSMSPPAIWIP